MKCGDLSVIWLKQQKYQNLTSAEKLSALLSLGYSDFFTIIVATAHRVASQTYSLSLLVKQRATIPR